ncbi:T-complex protein 1 subunit beta [Thalictrum thalictroides]|uniref:CCT-beta n=1 Tax=Thalictrum thalictroides TaxID=46969 RepID=A0A7J6WSB4_THATH|nr:T-complex protein 1 subunit beta [Thalictrum thalictroides]
MAVEHLFKDEATEEKGERARMASFIGAMAIADLVKTTLGPKGMDKILQSTGRGRNISVTNDGATILKSLHIDNPAAKVLVDISKVQDDEVGDGTTSVVVLAGELLREAEKLVAVKIHPMTIIAGYRMAAECAQKALLKKVMDNKDDAEKFKADLMKIAMTTLSSKILSQDKEHFATLAVDAVMRLKGSTNLESIQIIKKPGGSLIDSFLDEGFILDKKIGIGQPKRIENANILVANTAMDTDKVKIYGARVRVDSMARVAQIEGAEKEKMKEKVQKIISHGINCFINRQLIYNFPEELFADAGILAIEHADFDGIERLALVTGGEIASTFDNPESVKLGHCKLIEEIMIGEDKLIHFSGVEMGQACTIVLRGASNHVLDEAERSLHDALCVLSQTVVDSRVLLGGGWPEMVMAKEVDELARKTPGKKAHAIEAFSKALQAIPTTIADNAGLDSAELISQLRAEHHQEGSKAGIDVITGAVGDMEKLGISEAFKVKQAVLLSATEAAEMILRVDEIITCAPRRREDRIENFPILLQLDRKNRKGFTMDANLLEQGTTIEERNRVFEEIREVNDNMMLISHEAFKDILFILASILLLYHLVLPCNTKLPLVVIVLGAVFIVFTSFWSILQLKLVESRTISVGGQEFTVGRKKWLHIIVLIVLTFVGVMMIVSLSLCNKPCSG